MPKPKTKPKAKRKVGRPKFVIDYALISQLAMMHCTDSEIAHLCGMTPEGFCKRKKSDTELVQVLEKGRDEGKASLRRLQWKQAQSGDKTMLIWLGKQLLGQSDKREQKLDTSMTVNIVKPDRGKDNE